MDASEILKVFGELSIDGLWIGLGVFLVVQGAKICGFVTESSKITPVQLALGSALFFGLGWLAIEFAGVSAWSAEVIVGLIYRWFVGSVSAGLVYQIILKPLAGVVNIPDKFITAQD